MEILSILTLYTERKTLLQIETYISATTKSLEEEEQTFTKANKSWQLFIFKQSGLMVLMLLL
jgi:hypothetical protein